MIILACIFCLIITSAVASWCLCEHTINWIAGKVAAKQVKLTPRAAGFSPVLGEDWNLVWAGILLQCVCLLGVSLVVPLSWTTGLVFWGGIWLLVALIPSVRWRFKAILERGEQTIGWAAIGALTVGVAVYASQAPCNYDTLLYHHQATQWLSEHGAVRGVSLLHFRFGFISSSFALAAPFETILPHRTATIVNGVVLLVALLQITQGSIRILRGFGGAQHWFAVAGLCSVLALHLLFLEPVSAAPDFFVNVATVAIATGFIGANLIRDGSRGWTSFIAAALLPTVKLSAAPVAIVAAIVFIAWQGLSGIKARLLWSSAIALFAALPLVSVSWWQTGNLLFPVSALQTSTPWTISNESLREISHEIRDWARWGGTQPEGLLESDWLMRWLKSSKGALFLLAAVGNLIALFGTFMPSRIRRGLAREIAVPVMGILGAIYLFYAAPNPRFGFGMLMLGWAWVAQVVLPVIMHRFHWFQAPEEPSLHGKSLRYSAGGTGFVVACLAVGVLLALCVKPMDAWRKALNNHLAQSFIGSENGRINWLRPAKVPTIGYQRNDDGSIAGAFNVEFVEVKVNDLEYSHPVGTDIAGARRLPNASRFIEGIRLAEPERGIRGGFVLEQPPYFNP